MRNECGSRDREWMLAFALVLHLAVACGPPSRPIVAPNPVAADCIADRTSAELACVKAAKSSEEADRCIAKVKATQNCIDGGV